MEQQLILMMDRLIQVLEKQTNQMETNQKILLYLLHLPSEQAPFDLHEFSSMERNEDENEEGQVVWEGIIPDSVFDELAEQAFIEAENPPEQFNPSL